MRLYDGIKQWCMWENNHNGGAMKHILLEDHRRLKGTNLRSSHTQRRCQHPSSPNAKPLQTTHTMLGTKVSRLEAVAGRFQCSCLWTHSVPLSSGRSPAKKNCKMPRAFSDLPLEISTYLVTLFAATWPGGPAPQTSHIDPCTLGRSAQGGNPSPK